jgi:hypothetical protein
MLSVVLSMEHQNVPEVNKIDKGITSIASIFEIYRQVKEVDDARTVSVFGKFGEQHLLCVLVRDIPNHQGSSCIHSVLYSVEVKHQMLVALTAGGSR